MKKATIFLVLAALFVACNPEKKYASEIKEINRYQKSVDSLEVVFSNIKFDSLDYIHHAASTSEKMIKRYYMADTISRDLAKKLQYIKSVRKSLMSIRVRERSLAKEIGTLKVQFSNLEADIKNGVLNRNQIANFLNTEREAYNRLSENLTNVLDNQAEQLKDFYYAYPVVNSYVELIKPAED